MAQQRMTNKTAGSARGGGAAADGATEQQCTLKAITIRQTATPNIASIASSLQGGGAGTRRQGSRSAFVHRGPQRRRHQQSAASRLPLRGAVHCADRVLGVPLPVSPLSLRWSDELWSELIDGITADALDSLVHNALQSPKDFYTSLSLLFPLVALSPLTSLAFQSALTLLTQWGARLRSADSVLAEAVTLDYLLAKLVTLTGVQRDKAHLLMPLLWAFVRDDEAARGRLMANLSLHIAEPTLLLLALSALLTSSMVRLGLWPRCCP